MLGFKDFCFPIIKTVKVLIHFCIIQDGDHARMNALTTELVDSLFDDVKTSHEAFLRGVQLSGEHAVALHLETYHLLDSALHLSSTFQQRE